MPQQLETLDLVETLRADFNQGNTSAIIRPYSLTGVEEVMARGDKVPEFAVVLGHFQKPSLWPVGEPRPRYLSIIDLAKDKPHVRRQGISFKVGPGNRVEDTPLRLPYGHTETEPVDFRNRQDTGSTIKYAAALLRKATSVPPLVIDHVVTNRLILLPEINNYRPNPWKREI